MWCRVNMRKLVFVLVVDSKTTSLLGVFKFYNLVSSYLAWNDHGLSCFLLVTQRCDSLLYFFSQSLFCSSQSCTSRHFGSDESYLDSKPKSNDTRVEDVLRLWKYIDTGSRLYFITTFEKLIFYLWVGWKNNKTHTHGKLLIRFYLNR